MGKTRTFIGVDISDVIRTNTVALQKELAKTGAGVKWVSAESIHVTLLFLGEVDDVFILVLALQRLVSNAGRSVLAAHWTGAMEDLAELNLREALAAAAFFLPKRIRKRLRVIGR